MHHRSLASQRNEHGCCYERRQYDIDRRTTETTKSSISMASSCSSYLNKVYLLVREDLRSSIFWAHDSSVQIHCLGVQPLRRILDRWPGTFADTTTMRYSALLAPATSNSKKLQRCAQMGKRYLLPIWKILWHIQCDCRVERESCFHKAAASCTSRDYRKQRVSHWSDKGSRLFIRKIWEPITQKLWE